MSGGKLARLTEVLSCSAAEVIRHRIAQATPEDVPEGWRIVMEESQQYPPKEGLPS